MSGPQPGVEAVQCQLSFSRNVFLSMRRVPGSALGLNQMLLPALPQKQVLQMSRQTFAFT